MENGKTLAERIFDYRVKHRLSLEGMAKKSGVSMSSICRATQGDKNLRPITIARIEYAMKEDE